MKVLIAEADPDVANVWSKYLENQGTETLVASTQLQVLTALRNECFEVLVLDLMLPNASPLAISDFASYRCPDIAIVVVTANSYFSDGSIFEVIPNARGLLHSPVQTDDLVALVTHYGREGSRQRVS